MGSLCFIQVLMTNFLKIFLVGTFPHGPRPPLPPPPCFYVHLLPNDAMVHVRTNKSPKRSNYLKALFLQFRKNCIIYYHYRLTASNFFTAICYNLISQVPLIFAVTPILFISTIAVISNCSF